MSKSNRTIIASIFRFLFFAAFVILATYGIFARNEKQTYIPKNHGTPVISLALDARAVQNNNAPDSIFTSGNAPAFPSDSARASAVFCADTGEALYLKNADIPLPMASTTKIMTALVALEKLPLDMIFTVPAQVCGVEGSSIYLVPGEKIRVLDLLYGLLLESGNDAACALAVAACGNVEDFVSAMNEKARELGLVLTHFDNPHGLSSGEHRTTARELAIITYHAMKVPLFREICSTKNYTVKDENGTPVKYFSNHNRFLHSYSGAIGVKTGYTIASGRCLVTSAQRDDTTLIAVTLCDRRDFSDHAQLLDHAFENFRTLHIAKENSISFLAAGKRFANKERLCVCYDVNNGITLEGSVTLTE